MNMRIFLNFLMTFLLVALQHFCLKFISVGGPLHLTLIPSFKLTYKAFLYYEAFSLGDGALLPP